MGRDAARREKFKPIILKELLVDCDIPQALLAMETGVSRPSINLVVNRKYIPKTVEDFKEKVEKLVQGNAAAMRWLCDRGLSIKDIWKSSDKELRMAPPKGLHKRSWSTRKRPAMVPGDPDQITTVSWEVEMLSTEAIRHFKLFRNPFIDDVQKEADIYTSDEHRYIEEAMLDSARHGGFLAVVGEVGAGKSVMRRRVVERLRQDGDVLVIYPQTIDKGRLTAASICEAIIMDLSEEKPKIKLEAKTRQVLNLLLDRSKSGYRAVLMIEEAHDLNVSTLKYLKRFHELEDGYKKLLGIILIGQTELRQRFIESTHVEMREVIRRCQVAEIRGLNGNISDYLSLKFKRVGGDVGKIMDGEAIKALSKRLTTKDRDGKTISHAYPLLVNNYVARAMNMASEMGEGQVTEDIVMAI